MKLSSKKFGFFWMTCFLILFFQTGNSQDHSHKGFYLSMGLGPAFGKITASNSVDKLSVKGTAYAFDILLGGTPKENLVVHATIGIKSIFGPIVNGVKLTDNYELDEFVMGCGVTQYLPHNFLMGASIGSGKFSFVQDNQSNDTDEGFSYQLRAGKEWWISGRWSLGVAAQFSSTNLTSKYGDGLSEKWHSYRFGILFHATMHGKRNSSKQTK